MPVEILINQSGFNIRFQIAEWHDGLVVSKFTSENRDIVPAPAYLNLEYLRLLPDGEVWFSGIPHHWIEKVSLFRDQQLRLLSLIARSVGCQQIMKSPHRIILYLAVQYFPFDDQHIINAAESGVVQLLRVMRLSASPDALEFIAKVDISAMQYVSEIQALLANHHKDYQCFSAYPVITRTVLQLHRRYPDITNTILAVWLSQFYCDRLPVKVTDLLNEIASLVRQKAIPGGWRRFISLKSFLEMEEKMVRYKTLQRYRYADGLISLKKQEIPWCEELPEFESLTLIKRPRTLLRHCLMLQPPRLDIEYWDLYIAALNNEAILYKLKKPNTGVLVLKVFRNSVSYIKGLRVLCIKIDVQKYSGNNVLIDIYDGLNDYSKDFHVTIDYNHSWF